MDERIISIEEISDYLFEKLVRAGLAPQPGDLDIISDIFMDFLFEVGILIELEEDE